MHHDPVPRAVDHLAPQQGCKRARPDDDLRSVFEVWCLMFGVWVLGFGLLGLGFEFWGLEFRVWGLGTGSRFQG